MPHKVKKVMGEFKRGSLKSSAGPKVKSQKQAIAISLSEERRAGQHSVASRKLASRRRQQGY